MSGQHTQGRLVFKGTRLYEEGVVMDCIATMQVSNQPLWEADLRRLAACWNACNHLDTDHIESIAEVGVAAVIVTADIHRKDCETALRELASARALLLDAFQQDRLTAPLDEQIRAFLNGEPA
jgi:hypothetical protein